jgi:acetyl esterase/lipase
MKMSRSLSFRLDFRPVALGIPRVKKCPIQQQPICWLLIMTIVTAISAVNFNARQASAREAKLVNTYVYKQVGDLELKLDVYLPEASDQRSIVMWIHGGALIVGSRQVQWQ